MEKLTKTQLLEVAKQKGLNLSSKATKQEIIDNINSIKSKKVEETSYLGEY